MGRFFSDKTEEGIQLIWMQFDPEKAVAGKKLLEQAADAGEADAYCFLARTYLGVDGLEADRDKAFELLRKSMALHSACGILTMLQFKALAKEVMRNLDLAERKRAADEVLAKAEGGHPFCQLMVGMYYFWGGYWVSNELDPDEEYGNEDKALDARLTMAAPWFDKAVFGGLTAALVNLYDIYEAYPGNEEKLEKALGYAAQCGDPYWRIRYATWLFEQEKYEGALAAFEQLAQDGYPRAWYDVGFQHERGIGTPADPQRAIAAYEQGAKLGNSTCQTRLGKLLLWGKLVQKDEAQAYFWFCKAAEQNDEIAKMWKGHCMVYGLGTAEDLKDGPIFLIDALNYNFPGVGSSQQMANKSQFDWNEDMLQLFWDLAEANETGRGLRQRDHLAGYYYSMVADGGWPEAIEKMTHYKESGLFKRWKRIN